MGDAETGDGLSPGQRVEERVKKNGKKDKVIVEKSAAEGLPPGWIKELRITKGGHRVRRDPFYTDPKSGYIFRSFRDASRYVETGKIGKNAIKPRENGYHEEDSKDGKIYSLAGSMEAKSAESETSGDRMDLKFDEKEKDEKINYYVRSSKRKSIAFSDKKNSDSRAMSPKPRSSSSSVVTEEPEKIEEAEDSKTSSHICRPEGIVTPDKQPIERRITRSQSQAKKENNKENADSNQKVKRKKDINNSLLRRASKRLAGIELEPGLELKTRASASQKAEVEQSDHAVTRKCKGTLLEPDSGLDSCEKMEMPLGSTRACGSAVKQSDDGTAKECERLSSPKLKSASDIFIRTELPLAIEQSDEMVARKGGHSSPKLGLASDGCKMTEMPSVSTRTRRAAVAKSDQRVDRKDEGSSSTKPNIVPGSWKMKQMPSGSNKSKHISADFAALGSNGHATRKIEKTRNEVNKNQQGLASILPTTDPPVKRAHLSKYDINKANDGTSGPPPVELPLEDLWKDPCIAFAIKTLTGESLDPPNITELSTHDERQAIPEYQPYLGENSHNINEKIGSSLELPDADIWKDPCIEFAIKTLTGAIPLGFDLMDTQNNSQQPVVSSSSSPEFPASNYVCQQYSITRKPVSGGACLSQQCETPSSTHRVSPSFSKG